MKKNYSCLPNSKDRISQDQISIIDSDFFQQIVTNQKIKLCQQAFTFPNFNKKMGSSRSMDKNDSHSPSLQEKIYFNPLPKVKSLNNNLNFISFSKNRLDYKDQKKSNNCSSAAQIKINKKNELDSIHVSLDTDDNIKRTLYTSKLQGILFNKYSQNKLQTQANLKEKKTSNNIRSNFIDELDIMQIKLKSQQKNKKLAQNISHLQMQDINSIRSLSPSNHFSRFTNTNLQKSISSNQIQNMLRPTKNTYNGIFNIINQWLNNLMLQKQNFSSELIDEFLQKVFQYKSLDQSNKIEKEMVNGLVSFCKNLIYVIIDYNKSENQIYFQINSQKIQEIDIKIQQIKIQQEENDQQIKQQKQIIENLEKINQKLNDSIQLNQQLQLQKFNIMNLQKIQLIQDENAQLKQHIDQLNLKLKFQTMKETKILELLQAVEQSGVDLAKIYKDNKLDEDSLIHNTIKDSLQQSFQIAKKQKQYFQFTRKLNFSSSSNQGFADNSIINDSDESSFRYYGRSFEKEQYSLNNSHIISNICGIAPLNLIYKQN